MPSLKHTRTVNDTTSEIEVLSNVPNVHHFDIQPALQNAGKNVKANFDLVFDPKTGEATIVADIHANSEEGQDAELELIQKTIVELRNKISSDPIKFDVKNYIVMGDFNQNILKVDKKKAVVEKTLLSNIVSKLGSNVAHFKELAAPLGLMNKHRGSVAGAYNLYTDPQVSKDKKQVLNDSKDFILRFEFDDKLATIPKDTLEKEFDNVISKTNKALAKKDAVVLDVLENDTLFRDHFGSAVMEFGGVSYKADSYMPTAGLKAIADAKEWFTEDALKDPANIETKQEQSTAKLFEFLYQNANVVDANKPTDLKSYDNIQKALKALNEGFKSIAEPIMGDNFTPADLSADLQLAKEIAASFTGAKTAADANAVKAVKAVAKAKQEKDESLQAKEDLGKGNAATALTQAQAAQATKITTDTLALDAEKTAATKAKSEADALLATANQTYQTAIVEANKLVGDKKTVAITEADKVLAAAKLAKETAYTDADKAQANAQKTFDNAKDLAEAAVATAQTAANKESSDLANIDGQLTGFTTAYDKAEKDLANANESLKAINESIAKAEAFVTALTDHLAATEALNKYATDLTGLTTASEKAKNAYEEVVKANSNKAEADKVDETVLKNAADKAAKDLKDLTDSKALLDTSSANTLKALRTAVKPVAKDLCTKKFINLMQDAVKKWTETDEYKAVLTLVRVDRQAEIVADAKKISEDLVSDKDVPKAIEEFLNPAKPENIYKKDLANRIIQTCGQSQHQQMNAGYPKINGKVYPGPKVIDEAHTKSTLENAANLDKKGKLYYIATTEAGGVDTTKFKKRNKPAEFDAKMESGLAELPFAKWMSNKGYSKFAKTSMDKNIVSRLVPFLNEYKTALASKTEADINTKFDALMIFILTEKTQASKGLKDYLSVMQGEILEHKALVNAPKPVQADLTADFFKTQKVRDEERLKDDAAVVKNLADANNTWLAKNKAQITALYTKFDDLHKYGQTLKDDDMKFACTRVAADLRTNLNSFVNSTVGKTDADNDKSLANLKVNLAIIAHSFDMDMAKHRNIGYLVKEILVGIFTLGIAHAYKAYKTKTFGAGFFDQTNRQKAIAAIDNSAEELAARAAAAAG